MSQLHPVFHVSLLKKWVQGDPPEDVIPIPILIEGELEWIVEKVIAHREVKRRNKDVKEYLVMWEGYGPEENSWLMESELSETDAYADYTEALDENPAIRSERPPDENHRLRFS